jgi:hypothetical protein
MALNNTIHATCQCLVTADGMVALPPFIFAETMAPLRGIQQAGVQHIKLGPPVHLAFDEL